jgi:tyrosine-protein kinase Etk/Wzc
MTEREEFDHKTKYPDQTDYKLLLYRYTRFWYLFAIGLIVTVALALLYLYFATPQYLISTSIKVRGVDREPDYQAGSPGFRRLDVYDEAPKLEDEIEEIQSLSLLERVLTELNLVTSYHLDAGIAESELYGDKVPFKVLVKRLGRNAYKKEIAIKVKSSTNFILLDETGQETEHKFGDEIKTTYGIFSVVTTPQHTTWEESKPIDVRFHDLTDLAIFYKKEISVVQVGEESSILNVSMLHAIPEKGKDILNMLITLYNKENKEDKNRLAQNTIQFIDDRLVDLSSDLNNVEKQVEQFRRENQVTTPTNDAAAYLEESRLYNRELSDLNIKINVLQSLENYLSKKGEQNRLIPSNLSIDDQTLINLINQFNELHLERERRLKTLQPENPLLQNLNQQIISVKRDILENLAVIKKGLLVQRGNTSQKTTDFKSRLEQGPEIERELNEINRQLGVKQDLYNFLLQKREESSLSLAATTPNIKLIDPAISSKQPVSPNKTIALLIAVVLGLGLPFGLILVSDFLDSSIKVSKDVTQFTTLPIIGELPHIKKVKQWSALHYSSTPLTRHIGLTISNIMEKMSGTEENVLLITSGRNGEGKTFFCKNLALSLSQLNKRVVLVELDLRNPDILSDMGTHAKTGITDFIDSDNIPIESIIKLSDLSPNLYIINTGAIPANPAAVFASEKLGQTIAVLKQQFDYVIIDAAPVGQVADAFSLAPYTDLCIFIMRYNYTLKSEVNTVDNLNVKTKFEKRVIVLNDVRRMNSRSAS